MQLAKELNLFTINKKIAISKISEMINFNVNLITDEYVAKTEMIDTHINSEQIKLYKYLCLFYGDNKFDNIKDKRKNEILYSVFQKDSSILTKEDYKYISKIISESDYIKDKINEKINSISAMRSSIKDSIDRIESYIKIDTLNDSELEKITKLKSTLDKFKKITNFFVHIRDKEDNKYKKDISITKEYNSNFLDLKNDIKNFDSNSSFIDSMSEKYINLLVNLELEINDLINETKNYK